MEIYYFKPYDIRGNLGRAYNNYMEMLPNDDDYACFLDADTMFLCPDYGEQIYNTVKAHPEAGMFTCVTNRVGNIAQLYEHHLSMIGDVIYHRRLARAIWNRYKTNVAQLYKPISGLMMIIQKKTWKTIRFADGLLGVDTDISKKLLAKKMPILLMRGVYMFHYYRLLEGVKSKSHLKKKKK
jgi:GT2 family glycosyltransferase